MEEGRIHAGRLSAHPARDKRMRARRFAWLARRRVISLKLELGYGPAALRFQKWSRYAQPLQFRLLVRCP